MANTLDLRRRIKSVKNTSQITKAMQMVAASKMRRAQEKALAGRTYNDKLAEILHNLTGKIHLQKHPLLTKRAIDNATIIVVTPDKGLCGALNSNIFREISSNTKIKELKENTPTSFLTIGKKGRQFLAKTNQNIELDYQASVEPDLSFSTKISKTIIQDYHTKKTDLVLAVYTHFESTLKQSPNVLQILPIEKFLLPQEEITTIELGTNGNNSPDYLLEPNADIILRAILPHYVESLFYQLLLEASASEHSARMVAMKNATDNAVELTQDLTLTYNQVRQDAITREILEISTAAVALA